MKMIGPRPAASKNALRVIERTRIEKRVSCLNLSLTPGARPAIALLAAVLVFPVCSALAAIPAYKLGEVAAEDVITPVQLLVVNPEATDALKQNLARQVNFVLRFTPQSADEAETELRQSIATARTNFLAMLQLALGRAPAEADLASSQFAQTMREIALESPTALPLDKLAPRWVRAENDEALVESLLQPLREVMSQPVVSGRPDNLFPASEAVRLAVVTSATAIPTLQQLENAAPAISAGKVLSLRRARELVENSFPPGDQEMGRFAATFVRVNAHPDPELTEIWRAKRLQGVTVNDTYEAAEIVVRQGQAIDRKALSALSKLREKSLIATLQTQLEQEQSITGQIRKQTKWIAASLGGVCVALIFILWRRRERPSSELVLLSANPALAGMEPHAALPGDSASHRAWQQRALLAEGKAERAQEAIRSGALGWMREKIFRTMFRQRAELLSSQQKAESEMQALEQRLEQLHTPLGERISAYEKRIEELEKDLAAKGEENRKLIGARITVAQQQLISERQRDRFGTN